MSIVDYGNLTEGDKLIKSMHRVGPLGNSLQRILESFQHQFDQVFAVVETVVTESIQINHAVGTDLDGLAKILDTIRIGAESDESLRLKAQTKVANFNAVTVDGLVTVFTNMVGRPPIISEAFDTKVYVSGQTSDPTPGGRFSVIFNVPFTTVFEDCTIPTVQGNYVEVMGSIATDSTTVVSATTGVGSGDTTIYVASINDFPLNHGEIKIGSEYIFYGEALTSPPRLEHCVRGMYDSIPASHATNSPITEATTLAWEAENLHVVFDYAITDRIYLTKVYDPGRPIAVRYKTDVELTEADIIASIESLKRMGYELAAAGIRLDISIGIILASYYMQTMEGLEVTDGVGIDKLGERHFESITMPSESGPFAAPADWDSCYWDGTFWDMTAGQVSGSYYLWIQGHS
jgi:hypothetical protein